MTTKQQTSRAAVFSGAGNPLELHSFPTPSLQAGEALVAIELCTICGSDLHTIEGKRDEPTPSILGHEILGRVLEVGAPPPRGVDGAVLQPGDRVTWSTCISCGSCDRCLSGLPQKCVRIAKYGHERAEGRQALSGGMAERILLRDGSAIVRLDDSLPDAVACPVNCATATIAAAYRAAGDCRGRRVLVIGAGMLGLTAVAYAKHHGAERVTICDLEDQRLQRALRFGADRCVNVATEAVTESNLGTFDRIIECSGSADAIESALPLGDIGCRFVLVGSVMPSRPVAIDPQTMVRRWYSIHGIHNYAPCDLQAAVDFLVETHRQYPFESLVERTFPLAEVNEAIAHTFSTGAVRVGLRP